MKVKLNEIVIDAWKELSRLRSNSVSQPYVVDTMPILYFGDMEAYEKSDIKVITVGINPSDIEFRTKKIGSFSFFRFPLSEILKGINPVDLKQDGIDNYLKSLNNYFSNDEDPYWDWFKKNEPLLNGLGASYLPLNHPDRPKDKNVDSTAIHTDICSPIPTDPAWGWLSTQVKDVLLEQGEKLWLNLMERLQPDVILLSGGDYLKGEPLENGLKPLKILNPKQQCGVEVFKEYIYKTKPKKGEDPKLKTPYQVELHRFKLHSGKMAYIFYGNSANGWYATVGYRKKELGCEIKSFWETTRENSSSPNPLIIT